MKPSRRRPVLTGVLFVTVIAAFVVSGTGTFVARAADPIKIGLGMALTGGLSANGKPALLALQIWKDDVNKKGGLLGRPVELVFYGLAAERDRQLRLLGARAAVHGRVRRQGVLE
jgi:hypothetical protein